VNYALLDSSPMVALHQPQWEDMALVARVRNDLAASHPLVQAGSLQTLQSLLARVAAGQAHVIQAGDCAEDPAECTAGDVARKAGLLDVLAGVLKMITCKPVVRVGRIAGQYGKPR
jgi:3-deoxy-7-phosphoheptulonate synthase